MPTTKSLDEPNLVIPIFSDILQSLSDHVTDSAYDVEFKSVKDLKLIVIGGQLAAPFLEITDLPNFSPNNLLVALAEYCVASCCWSNRLFNQFHPISTTKYL